MGILLVIRFGKSCQQSIRIFTFIFKIIRRMCVHYCVYRVISSDLRNASASSYLHNNTTLLANYCPGQTPRSCDHFLLTRQQRPCTLSESFLSTSRSLTVQLNIQHATALRSVLCALWLLYFSI